MLSGRILKIKKALGFSVSLGNLKILVYCVCSQAVGVRFYLVLSSFIVRNDICINVVFL